MASVAFVQATAGAAGGIFASFTLMPLEVIKTRIQVSREGDTSMGVVAKKILQADGVSGLFSGVGAKCTETGSKNFVYFYIYDALNQMVKKDKVGTLMKLALGYVAGVGTTTLTMPLEVLSTKLQLETPDGEETGLVAVVTRLVNEEGIIGGLFKGFWFNIMLCINPAIQNTCFDKFKDVVMLRKAASMGKDAALSPLEAFVMGALAKAIATVITFPLVRLKTILQTSSKSEEPKQEKTPPTLRLPLKKRSLSRQLSAISFRLDKEEEVQGPLERLGSLYRGMGSALFKTVLQAALLYMTKDTVEGFVVSLFKLLPKVLKRRSGKVKLGAFSGRPLAS